MWRAWAGLSGLVAALAIGVAALAMPRVMFPDARHQLDAATVRYTRGEALHWSKIPPLRLQITSIRPPSPLPQAPANATLKWRTIFGVAYGTTVIERDGSGQQWDHAAAYRAWAAFVVVELLLVGFAVWCLWTSP